MQDLHSMCIDKSSCKAALEKHQFHVHELTKDSFKKAYEQSGKSGTDQLYTDPK